MEEEKIGGKNTPVNAIKKQIEIEERALTALSQNSIQPTVLRSQQQRIDYLKGIITNPAGEELSPDEQEKLEFILVDSQLTTEKIDWKIKVLERKAFIEMQYVEAAAKMDMAYGELKQDEVVSSLIEAQQRYSVLQTSLQKWRSLRPGLASSPQKHLADFNDPVNDNRCIYGKIEVNYLCKENDCIIRFLSDHENVIHVGKQSGKFSFKADGIMELEVHFLNSRSKAVQAMGFFPLGLFLIPSKEFLKLEMEAEGSISLQVKIKLKPKDRIERRPAILRKALNGHLLEEKQVHHLRKCSVCNEFCFFRKEGVSCRECRIFSHKRCTITTRCNLSSMHQRTSSFDSKKQVLYEKRHTSHGATILFPTWCHHCGLIIPFGTKSASKCEDCGKIWHVECCAFVPNTCGVVRLLSKLEQHNLNSIADSDKAATSIGRYTSISCLGRGNFGKVLLVKRDNDKNELYAVKVLKKKKILENEEFENVKTEQRILELATRENHPYLVHLKECFQDETCVYFVLEYASGGDLLYLVQSDREISESDKRYFNV
jgi:hypothetical protein